MTELTKSEFEIMKILWEADRDLMLMEILPLAEQKYHKVWKRQTVSTFLSHLIEKGVALSYRRGRYFYYRPLAKEEDYKLTELKSTVDFWCNGSVSNLVSTLCRRENMSEERLAKIEEMLNDLELMDQ